jgi:hypothetical protein
MIPLRFITEFPERCELLISMLENFAREKRLLGTFSLLAAAGAFTIPFSRVAEGDHPLGNKEPEIEKAIKGLKKVNFLEAPFWPKKSDIFFRYAKVVTDPEIVSNWADELDQHPFFSKEKKDARTVLRTIRNALAHGNVAYLDKNGREIPESRVEYLGFISRHDDEVSHRVVIFSEESFIQFLKVWLAWLQTFPQPIGFKFDDAA